MPFRRGKEGKENRTYKLNKAGAKIGTYHKFAIIANVDTFEIVKYGELDEMRKYIDEKYYNNSRYHLRTFRYMIHYSDCWIPEALNKMIDDGDIEFTSELDYPNTNHLFVEEKGIGAIYHNFTVSGDPPTSYWLDSERKWKLVMDSKDNPSSSVSVDEAAEKRRQRSLKAAETMRKKREANLEKQNG